MSWTPKVLVVGSGDMGARHLDGYRALSAVSGLAVADPDRARAEKLANEFAVPAVYADYREAVERERPDIVSVCVPAFLHAEVALFALGHGCNVLCEKPIALTLHDARRMADAAAKGPGKLGIVFQRRFTKIWREVAARLPALGTPLSYQAADFRPIRPKLLMHSQSGNGGPVIDCCVHDFDMARRFFGDVQQVYAMGDTYASGKKELASISDLAVDTAVVSLRFKNGHKAAVSYCWGLPTGFGEVCRNEILGPDGVLRVFEDAVEHHMPDGRVETVSGLASDGHTAQIAAYVQALESGEAPPVAPEEALAALETAYAALESIATGNIMRPGAQPG